MRRRAGIAGLAALLCCAALAQNAPPGPASAVASRPIAFKQEEDFATQLARVGVGLVLALGIGAAALAVYKRSSAPQRGGRRLRLLETLRLGPKQSLLLVELDGKTLLIGQNGETLAVLERPAAQDVN